MNSYRPWLLSFAIHSITSLGLLLLFLASQKLPSKKQYYRAHLQISSKNSALPSAPSAPLPPKKSAAGNSNLTNSSSVTTTSTDVQVQDQQETAAAGSSNLQDLGLPAPVEEYLVTQMPSLKQEAAVAYPPEAKTKGVEGSVVTQLLIDEQGVVVDVQWIEGPEIFKSAALKALKQFTFNPAKIGQEFVPVQITYRLNFKLN